MTSRRRVVLTLAGACAGASTLTACAGVATFRAAAPVAGSGLVEVPRAEFTRLALDRGAVRVESPALPEPVILLAVESGFRALGSTCTHQQCTVRPGRTFLRCPCHGSTFDLTGAVVRGPAPRDLPVYATSSDDTTIRIATAPASPPSAPA